MANFSTLLQPTTYCKKRPYFIIIYIHRCCCFVCTVIAYCCYFESGLSINGDISSSLESLFISIL